jgi:hypothetical protein
MPFLPSLLEYSPQNLQARLITILDNKHKFLEFQKSKTITLHLDFVLPEFAESRGVTAGNSPEIVFENIRKVFGNQPLILNTHFMGLNGDMGEVFDFLEEFEMESEWKMTVFVDEKYINKFNNLASSRLTVGQWLDLGEYDAETELFEGNNYLLMTVVAGKSGQKLTEEVKNTALQIVKNNPEVGFTIDGGWSVDFELTDPNLNIVSYSSFWKEFEKVI